MKKFFLYLVRWQLSSPILAVCMVWMGGWNVALATIVANLIGGCIFFWVDRWIFGDKKISLKAFKMKKSKTEVPVAVAAIISPEDDEEDNLL